jgi:hypothetical protein
MTNYYGEAGRKAEHFDEQQKRRVADKCRGDMRASASGG